MTRASADTVAGHPRGLPVLISLKVWELFSYQGMRAFLVLFLIDHFGLGDARAALVFGSYAALVLATSVLGGICADRWLGAKRAMLIGALLIMAGHLTLATDTLLAGAAVPVEAFQIFCLGLALIAVGTGLLKPSVLTAIGRLYRDDDKRRETGFYVYYIGVNVGSFLAPIVCGGLARSYGWSWGFAAAAIGMALGVASFLAGRRFVVSAERHADTRRRVPPALYLAIIATVAVAALLVQHGVALGIVLALTLGGGLALFQRRANAAGEHDATRRLLALLPVPIVFELLFEQLSTSVTLFADRAVTQQAFGIAISAPQLLALNGLFVLALLPLVATVWRVLAARGAEPPAFVKFAIGFTLIALSFVMLSAGARTGAPAARVDLLWIVGAYLLLTLGELCIAPLALSLVGLAVPAQLGGLAMGLMLLSFAIGNFLSSLLAGVVALPRDLALPTMKLDYAQFFLWPAGIAAAYAILCLVVARGTRSRTHTMPKRVAA